MHLIFDFDGTLADTHHYIIDISNRLSSEFRFKAILPHEVPALKHKTSREIIQHLDVPLLKIPAILTRAKKEFYTGIHRIRPFNGLQELLPRLQQLGFRLGILSSNALNNIHTFLAMHQMDCFDFVQATSHVWSKNQALGRVVKDHHLSMDRLLYVGDETRDIVAARKLGLKIAAVTWGYNSEEILQQNNPDYLVRSTDELYEACRNFLAANGPRPGS